MPRTIGVVMISLLCMLAASIADADSKVISFKEKLTHTRDNIPVSIPKSWGDLIATNYITSYDDKIPVALELLYFKDDEGTIRMVRRHEFQNIDSNKNYEIEVIVLPRQ